VDRWRTIDTESNSVDHFGFRGVKFPNSFALGFAILRSPKSRWSKGALKSQPCERIGVSENRVSGIEGTSCLTSRPPKSR
jgi:hypothetical protein